jgi:hypothetical protein
MAGGTSEKEARLKYKIQPFARQFFVAILIFQLLSAKDWHIFLSIKSL